LDRVAGTEAGRIMIVVLQWAWIASFAHKRSWFLRGYRIFHTHAGWLIPTGCLRLDHDKCGWGIGIVLLGLQISFLRAHRITDAEFDALENPVCPF
jgi:hypothetical protein